MAKLKIERTPTFSKDDSGNLHAAVDTPGVRPGNLKVRVDGKSVLVDVRGDEPSVLVKLPRGVEPEKAEAEYVFGRLFLTVVPRTVKPFEVAVTVATE